MQGTIAILMALSGLGCHHKSADVAYAPSCYSSCYNSCYSAGCYSSVSYQPTAQSCYASATPVSYVSGCYSSCYSSCYSGYADSCYSGCYNSCYSGCYNSCYSGGGHFAKKRRGGGLFSCFKRNRCAPVVASCDTCDIGGYGGGWGTPVPVYGSYTPAYATTQYPTSQGDYTTPMTNPGEAPAATGAPEAPAPVNPIEDSPPANPVPAIPDVPAAPVPAPAPGV